MAPFDGKLTTKISPLIEGQVPDFVQADHPKYVEFLKSYYKFLEAGELVVKVTIDSIRMETVSVNHLLGEGDDRVKLNTETGTGTTGKFVVGETITGSTSKATAEVLVDDLGNERIFISSQQKFEIGETITGSSSEATATIVSYRGNPIQNIQQLLEYSNTDNTTATFLDEMYNMYMQAIPKTLASGASKRNLLKSIRDLYSSKGTSEGIKLFLRILFDKEAEIVYPNKFMMKPSTGTWSQPTIMRVEARGGSDADDIVGQKITGSTSGATTVILDATIFSQGGVSVSQLEIDPDETKGTFVTGETITSTSNTLDSIMTFVVKSFVTGSTITTGGSLYRPNDSLNIDSTAGNGRADLEVQEISAGTVNGVTIDDRGQDYKIGDTVSFTANAIDTNISGGSGVVTAVGGTILLEDTIGNDDFLTIETGTNSSTPHPYISFEDGDIMSLNGTNGSSDNADFQMLMEDATPRNTIADNYGTDFDRFIIEEATADTSGELSRVLLTNGGGGYTKLPTLSLTSTKGTGGKLIATSDDIGKILSVKIKDGGFNYTTPPVTTTNTQFVLKDVTGSFVGSNTLTTHQGTVKKYDSATQHLEVDFENVENIKIEAEANVTEGIQLEQNIPTGEKIQLNNTLDSDGDNISLEDGQGVLVSNAIKTMGSQITLQNTGSVNQRMELEEKVGDATLEDLFGFNARQAVARGAPDQFIVPELTERGNLFKLEGSVVGGSILINSTDGSADAGDEILLDGTDGSSSNAGSKVIQVSDDEGNSILYENEPAIPHIQQRFNKLQLDGTLLQRSTPKGWITDDGSGADTLYENQGGFRVADETDGILLEDAEADATYNTKEFLIMEDGGLYEFYEEKVINHLNTPDGRLMDEESGGFSLEKEFPHILIDDGSNITLNNHITIESEDIGNILLNGTDGSSSNAGSFLQDEEFGDRLRQEKDSGSGTNLGDLLLHEVEDNEVNQKLIDETDGDNIISESEPTLIGDTITDSGGASGTIIKVDTANITPTVGVESELSGFYRNTDHHISDGVIRLQDSFFYQDFSYEIRLGEAIENYITELRKAVHPAGFAVFGKVTLATLITANIQVPAGSGVQDLTSDTTVFSPALASTLENIFQIPIPRRLEVGTTLLDGEFIQRVRLETATDSAIDSNIVNEQTLEAISLETAAKPPNDGHEVSLLKTAKVTIGLPAPTFFTEAGSRSGLPLFAQTQLIANGIEMEDGARQSSPSVMRDRIIADGIIQASGAIGDVGAVLEQEDATDADFGSGLTFDDLQFESNDAFIQEQTGTYTQEIALEDGGLLLEETDGDNIIGETETGNGGLLLDSTDGTNDIGFPIVTEDILNGEITIEEIIKTDLLSLEGIGKGDNFNEDHILSEQSMEVGDILQETGFEILLNEDGDRFDLEDDTGKIIREIGDDGNFGQKMIVEDATTPQRGGVMQLDSQNLETEDGTSNGTIPELNFRETNFPHFTRPTMIKTMAGHFISLQDERAVTFITLDGTDGSSSNAGDNIIFDRTLSTGQDAGDSLLAEEGAKVILDQHNPGLVLLETGNRVEKEIGTKPPYTYPIFRPGGLAATYDATTLTYDSTDQTYDTTS